MLRRLWLTIVGLALIVSGCARSAPPVVAPPPPPSASPAPASSGPSSNLSEPMSQAIDAFVSPDKVETRSIRAVAVNQHGALVAERYFGSSATEYADVQSVTKSVLATLVGIAIDEGRISGVDVTLAEALPQYRDRMADSSARITLRQLLTMTGGWSGLPEGVDLTSPDLVGKILAAGPSAKVGEFNYDNTSAHLTAAVLKQAVGRPVLDYAREKLFDPLGIVSTPAYEGPMAEEESPEHRASNFSWLTDADGVHSGYATLRLTVLDMLKIGQLYLNGGQWEGRQIVPAAFVTEAISYDPNSTYGYFWWGFGIGDQTGYEAIGQYGQMVFVAPQLDAVIAISSRAADETQDNISTLDQMIAETIFPNLT